MAKGKPKKPKGKLLSRHAVGGHTLLVYLYPDDSRVLHCASWPELAGRYDSAADAIRAIDEWERRASGQPPKADENAKGAA